MKKAVFSKKSTTTTDVVVQGKKPQKGPVALDLADLKQVSGGLPKGGWATDLPKGGWV